MPVDVVMMESVSWDLIGEIPEWLDENDPRPARAQLHDHYRHGGGWMPFEGHTLRMNDLALCYPGDPPQLPIALMILRHEKIVMYHHAWVMILQPDGSYEVSRMD